MPNPLRHDRTDNGEHWEFRETFTVTAPSSPSRRVLLASSSYEHSYGLRTSATEGGEKNGFTFPAPTISSVGEGRTKIPTPTPSIVSTSAPPSSGDRWFSHAPKESTSDAPNNGNNVKGLPLPTGSEELVFDMLVPASIWDGTRGDGLSPSPSPRHPPTFLRPEAERSTGTLAPVDVSPTEVTSPNIVDGMREDDTASASRMRSPSLAENSALHPASTPPPVVAMGAPDRIEMLSLNLSPTEAPPTPPSIATPATILSTFMSAEDTGGVSNPSTNTEFPSGTVSSDDFTWALILADTDAPTSSPASTTEVPSQHGGGWVLNPTALPLDVIVTDQPSAFPQQASLSPAGMNKKDLAISAAPTGSTTKGEPGTDHVVPSSNAPVAPSQPIVTDAPNASLSPAAAGTNGPAMENSNFSTWVESSLEPTDTPTSMPTTSSRSTTPSGVQTATPIASLSETPKSVPTAVPTAAFFVENSFGPSAAPNGVEDNPTVSPSMFPKASSIAPLTASPTATQIELTEDTDDGTIEEGFIDKDEGSGSSTSAPTTKAPASTSLETIAPTAQPTVAGSITSSSDAPTSNPTTATDSSADSERGWLWSLQSGTDGDDRVHALAQGVREDVEDFYMAETEERSLDAG